MVCIWSYDLDNGTIIYRLDHKLNMKSESPHWKLELLLVVEYNSITGQFKVNWGKRSEKNAGTFWDKWKATVSRSFWFSLGVREP